MTIISTKVNKNKHQFMLFFCFQNKRPYKNLKPCGYAAAGTAIIGQIEFERISHPRGRLNGKRP